MLPRRMPKSTRVRRNVRPAVKESPASSGSSFMSSFDWGKIRLISVGVFFAVLWGALWGRAYYLQIIEGPKLAAMARREHVTTRTVQGVRGSILDRNGDILARSVDSQSVWVNPTAVLDKESTAAALSSILGLPSGKILASLKTNKRFVWISRKLDPAQAERIRAAKLPGVALDSEFERVYPNRHLAGQLLGYVDIDDKGIEGLELMFNETLAGTERKQRMERDAAGRRMVTSDSDQETDDLNGEDVRLTIDSKIQFFAEEALKDNVDKFEAKWGGCLVVDVPTGEILAWAQYPFFDPNTAARFPLNVRRNRLATDALEQGSTIKSFLVAAALEEKTVKPATVINCEKGKWKLRTAVIHDTHPYASLPVSKILHVSSNIGAAKIGMTLGAERYAGFLTRLGFGSRTGLPLAGEAKGILRPAKSWADVDLAAASFGQSFSATMVQMAQAYLTLAGNGERKSLRLISEENTQQENAPRVFTEETLSLVRSMLRDVVEEEGGTGGQARIPGMVVGGKTGTAQKADGKGKYGAGRVGSFVGMVPIEQPRYLICVLLDEPSKNQYGGVNAAPVFRDVALQTMAYHGLLPDTDDPLVRAAAEKASRKGPGRNKGNAQAAKPAPSAAPAQAAAPERRKTEPDEVPDLVGLGVRSAVERVAAAGVVPSVKGKGGLVVRQTPEAGTKWPAAKICTLWLEDQSQ